jgi:ABC-type phosphate transport system substrate-binding protein
MWNHPDIVDLNRDFESELDQYGNITVFVREDSSGTTEIFKKALSAFEDGFREQIGTVNASEPSWPNATVMKATLNEGVIASVSMTPGSIGYSVFVPTFDLDVEIALLLKRDNNTVVAGDTSVSFAVVEKGLDFGNNLDDPSRLTADLHDALGSFAWPIVGYTYFVIRKNTLREGENEDCANRIATYEFLEWYYTNDVVSNLIRDQGFAPLPGEVSKLVLDRLRGDMQCEDKLIYTPQLLFAVSVAGNRAIEPTLNLVESVYLLLESNFTFKSLRTNKTFDVSNFLSHDAGQDAPLIIDFRRKIDQVGLNNIRTSRFIGIAMVGIFNLCGAINWSTCSYANLELTVSPQSLAGILSGNITMWNDDGLEWSINDDFEEIELNPPSEAIRLFYSSDNSDEEWYEGLFFQLREDAPDLKFNSTGIGKTNLNQVKASVRATPYSFAVVPLVDDIGILSKVANVRIDDSLLVSATTEAIGACDSPSIKSACYPFTQFLDVAFFSDFSGNDCEAESGNKSRALMFAEFVSWFINDQTMKDPVNGNGMSFLPSKMELEQLRVSVACNGQSLLRPRHNLNLVPQSFKVLIYSLIGMASLSVFVLAIMVIWFRKTRLIKNTTPSFLLQVLLGCLISLMAIPPLMQDDQSLWGNDGSLFKVDDSLKSIDVNLDLACQSAPFLFFCGLSISLVPLLLKTWRIHAIFNQTTLRRIDIPNGLLLKYEAAVLGTLIAILVTWTILDPLEFHREVVRVDISGAVVESIGRCTCKTPIVWLAPLASVVFFFLCVGCSLSYHVRNVPVEFSEGQWIGVAMINFLEMFVLAIPILIITADKPSADGVMKSMVVFCSSFGTILIIFVPKFYMAMNDDKAMQRWRFSWNANDILGSSNNASRNDLEEPMQVHDRKQDTSRHSRVELIPSNYEQKMKSMAGSSTTKDSLLSHSSVNLQVVGHEISEAQSERTSSVSSSRSSHFPQFYFSEPMRTSRK